VPPWVWNALTLVAVALGVAAAVLGAVDETWTLGFGGAAIIVLALLIRGIGGPASGRRVR
jgi:hypothetical protein